MSGNGSYAMDGLYYDKRPIGLTPDEGPGWSYTKPYDSRQENLLLLNPITGADGLPIERYRASRIFSEHEFCYGQGQQADTFVNVCVAGTLHYSLMEVPAERFPDYLAAHRRSYNLGIVTVDVGESVIDYLETILRAHFMNRLRKNGVVRNCLGFHNQLGIDMDQARRPNAFRDTNPSN
jgi:hypothetical protein